MTKVICLAVFLLLCAASVFLLRWDKDLKERLNAFTEKQGKIRSFKKQGKVSRAIRRLLLKRQALLQSSDMPPAAYWALTVLGAVGGFLAGRVIYSSYFIALAVSAAGMIVPLLVMGFRQTKSGTLRTERLCSSMMLLSNAYLSTEDFIQAVEENLPNLAYPAPFRQFLTYVSLMDSDVPRALRRMEADEPNPYFSQWVDALVLAQGDRSLIYVCGSVVDAMHDVIIAQQESDAAMYAVWRDYLLTLILIFSVPLVFRFLLPDAYVTLTTSLVGQSLFLLLLAAVFYSVLRALKINRPLMR